MSTPIVREVIRGPMAEPRPTTDLTLSLFALALVNLGVYAMWHSMSPRFMAENFLVSVESVTSGRLWTLLTTIFSHQDSSHLLFNLFGLWVFGTPVERVIGPVRFALLYLLAGLAGSFGYVGWAMATGSPAGALGASGAVMGIAALYGMWFPNRTLMINFLIPMPAWMAVFFFIALDLAGAFDGGGTVANAAHLGGAFFGLALGLPRFLKR